MFYFSKFVQLLSISNISYSPKDIVVNTSRSFPHIWLITEFVTRLTQRVPLVDQELLTLLEHLSSPLVFSGVRVTRSLVLCVCFVDRCLYFFFWPLCCLFFFDIRILITPLVSSNSSLELHFLPLSVCQHFVYTMIIRCYYCTSYVYHLSSFICGNQIVQPECYPIAILSLHKAAILISWR